MVGGEHVAPVGDLFTYSVCNPNPRALVAEGFTFYHGFQPCAPRVVPLSCGILLRDFRGLYTGYIQAILGKPLRGTALGVKDIVETRKP